MSALRVSTMQEQRMKREPMEHSADEPVGIVISGGSRAEPVPAFTMYLWQPAPDGADGGSEPKVAA